MKKLGVITILTTALIYTFSLAANAHSSSEHEDEHEAFERAVIHQQRITTTIAAARKRREAKRARIAAQEAAARDKAPPDILNSIDTGAPL